MLLIFGVQQSETKISKHHAGYACKGITISLIIIGPPILTGGRYAFKQRIET